MPGSEPTNYYDMYSSKAMAKHKAVLWPIIMDGQPYSWIDSPGTNLMFRILDPQYTLHTASFYRDLIGKVVLEYKIYWFLLFANNPPSTRSTPSPWRSLRPRCTTPTPSTSCLSSALSTQLVDAA